MFKIFLLNVGFMVALISASGGFQLPMIIDFGNRSPDIPRAQFDVQSLGPFVQLRNLTFRFEWETSNYTIHGIRLRGSEPRYERVSVTLNRLEKQAYSVEINVFNSNFALFWCEAYGVEDSQMSQKN
jgi:hypothetical protein